MRRALHKKKRRGDEKRDETCQAPKRNRSPQKRCKYNLGSDVFVLATNTNAKSAILPATDDEQRIKARADPSMLAPKPISSKLPVPGC